MKKGRVILLSKKRKSILIVALTCIMLIGSSMIAYASTASFTTELGANEWDYCKNSVGRVSSVTKSDWEQRAYVTTTQGYVSPSMNVRFAVGTDSTRCTGYVSVTTCPGKYSASYIVTARPGNNYYLKCFNGGTYYSGAGRWTP